MGSRTKTRIPRSSGRTQHASEWLLILSVLTMFGAALLVGVGIQEQTSGGKSVTAELLFSELGKLVAGAALSAVFLSLSWLLGTLDGLGRSLDRFRNALDGSGGSMATNGAGRRANSNGLLGPEEVREMRELLEEIRDNTLMNEEQKRERWELVLAHRRKNLSETVYDRIERKRFADGAHELDRFEELYGRDAATTELRRKLDAARRLAERRDLAEALENYATLKANRKWGEALRRAEKLLNTYPQSIEARQWLEQIHRDREQVSAEHRRALLDQTQKRGSERQWRKALASARALLDEYPESAEAQSVRPQLETLEFNAGVETRQELEEQIKDLISRRDFAEALELANQVIVRYPESPQAEALRGQLPRLREHVGQQAGR